MKINKIFNTIVLCLFIIFISLYLASINGYYEYENSQKVKFTDEKIKEFEEDIKNGEVVDINNYLESDTKNYDNKVTKLGLNLSNVLNNCITSGLEKTFKLVEKLIE